MTIHDMTLGDEVFVNSPARHAGDFRRMCGIARVVGIFPFHCCGPCLQVEDKLGVAMVPCYCCLPMSIQNVPQEAS